MKCNVNYWRVFSAFVLIILGTQPAWAETIVCPPGDNAVIQACIDQAAPGDRIVFSGNYQIDPDQPFVRIVNKSNLQLVGDEENPPQFNGRVAPDGRPLLVASANNGFNVLADGAQVSGLVFDGLDFTGCGIAINLLTANGGTYADITIRNVAITNSYVGLEVTGVEDGLTIRDCSIARTDIGMRVRGQNVHSTGIDIAGNDVVGLGADEIGKLTQTGILLDRVDGRVHDNLVTGFTKFVIRAGIGIVVQDTVDSSFDASVFGNFVADNQVGISLGGVAAADGRVFDNIVWRSSVYGINLRFGANDWRIGLNAISDSEIVDVNLTGIRTVPPIDPFGTFGNTVYLTAGQTYSDAGSQNTIIVRHD